ncbi:glycosyltransferase family 4 protein [Caldibacillus thermoamylovorans]
MKNVLMLTPVFEKGGTEVYIINLSKFLSKNDFNVTVMSAGGIRESSLKKEGIRSIVSKNFGEKSFLNLVKSAYQVYRAIKVNNISIIHASSIYTSIIGKVAAIFCFIFSKRKVPVILTLHGGPNKNIEKESAFLLNLFTDRVIALSENAKNELIMNGLRGNKVHVIYNGIEIPDLKNNYSFFDDGIINIITTGRLTEQKGHVYLIKAAAILKEKIGNSFCIYILGDGEKKEDLSSMIEGYSLEKNIKLLGFKNEPLKYLSCADIFVLPSLWEQFPISSLEAMGLGKPIIASNVNGLPEQIKDAGILINPASEYEIYDALLYLIENKSKRETYSELAKKRFEENFTLSSMGEKTIRVYKGLF